jgi:hypothetical protein
LNDIILLWEAEIQLCSCWKTWNFMGFDLSYFVEILWYDLAAV